MSLDPVNAAIRTRASRAAALSAIASVAIIVILAIATSSCSQRSAADADTVGQGAPCAAPASWFPVAPLPNADVEPITNCDFHMWSWQMFLWLMQTGPDGGPRFLAMAPSDNLFMKTGTPGPYPGGPTGAGSTVLGTRRLKADTGFEVEEIGQAGGGSVLFDQASQVVYYEKRVNDVYYDFILSNGYYNAAGAAASPANTKFPNGAVEIKVSWRIAEVSGTTYIPNAASRFLTCEAMIAPLVSTDGGPLQEKTDQPVLATMAMVGMHVVGAVEGHPELIWATFEHQDNAPYCADTPVAGGGPGGPWSFYSPNTACTASGGDCNTTSYSDTDLPTPADLVPTQVCLVDPQGGGDASNVANVVALNGSVHAQLPEDSILNSYLLGGALWTLNGTSPSTTSNQRGSLKLANTTMETFFQGQLNCFACHHPVAGSNGDDNYLFISHLVPSHH